MSAPPRKQRRLASKRQSSSSDKTRLQVIAEAMEDACMSCGATPYLNGGVYCVGRTSPGGELVGACLNCASSRLTETVYVSACHSTPAWQAADRAWFDTHPHRNVYARPTTRSELAACHARDGEAFEAAAERSHAAKYVPITIVKRTYRDDCRQRSIMFLPAEALDEDEATLAARLEGQPRYDDVVEVARRQAQHRGTLPDDLIVSTLRGFGIIRDDAHGHPEPDDWS